MYGTIANNILPFSNTQNPDDLTKNLFFESGVTDIGYLIHDKFEIQNLEENKDNLVEQVALTVVFDQNGNENITEKQQQISDTWSIGTIDNVNDTKITYVSFYYLGEKYIFFSDLELARSRVDDSTIREATNMASFISNKNLIEDNLKEIIEKNQSILIRFYIFLSLIVSLISVFIAIISSHKLSNTIMDNVIDMCVKMKIAQITQSKYLKQTQDDNTMVFSERFRIQDTSADITNKYEIKLLFNEIEDMLRLFRIMNFKLSENNTVAYNNSAVYEYSDLISMYQRMINHIKNKIDKKSRRSYIKLLNKLKYLQSKCYNNIGCLWYAIGDFYEANTQFRQALDLLQQLNKANFEERVNDPEGYSDISTNYTFFSKLQKVELSINLNYSLSYIKEAQETYQEDKDEVQFRSNLLYILNMLEAQSHNNLSARSFSEQEILTTIIMIRINYILGQIDKIDANIYKLKTFKRIAHLRGESNIESLMKQYYSTFKAIWHMKNLNMLNNLFDQNKRTYFKRRQTIIRDKNDYGNMLTVKNNSSVAYSK